MAIASDQLPIDAVLPELTSALRNHNAAVLGAPPGAGKTTRVPLVLAQEDWAKDQKILVLEPRRLAARAAAARMAATLGERLGETVGLRVRFGSKVSAKTRIEIVTEGIFTRLILDDPELKGIAAVLFDEFHERSLDADLGLALARDAQVGLREDLKIVVMSATLDGERVATLLGGAPVIESGGRAFPVETVYLGRNPRESIAPQMANAVQRAVRLQPGSVLAFLPGVGEIRRTETLLNEQLKDDGVDVVALYGALDSDVQDRAIAPAQSGRRKVVLATSIAETSLTIEGVRIVIDSGLARVPRYEPDVGLTRLETVRVSRAAADQRRGRAGRTEPGVCFRLWDEPETGSLAAFATPEILASDLSSFVLDLAQWGVSDPATLAFLDLPPAPALAEAKTLLRSLGALDEDGRITEEGRALRALPLPPRLARMILDAARVNEATLAAQIAVLVSERGLGGDDPDLTHRLEQFRRDRSRRTEDARAMAKRWAALAAAFSPDAQLHPIIESDAGPRGVKRKMSPGAILALAYPDRIAKNRGQGSFQLANGRRAQLDETSPLMREPYLAVAETVGRAAQARILLAAPMTAEEIESNFVHRIEVRDEIVFDPARAGLQRRTARRLGAFNLTEQIAPAEPDDLTPGMLLRGILSLGLDRLPWTPSLRQWRDRVLFLRWHEGDEWPDLSDAALARAAEEWLLPVLSDKIAVAALSNDEFAAALHSLLSWTLRKRLEAEAPTHFHAPTGTSVPIDYDAEAGATISIRLQELFGLAAHPSIAGGRVPLVIELLSPAQRPVQVTRDLPGFWRGSYQAVKAEMKGRYPRHPWPDDPMQAAPTRRAKPRGT